MTVVLPSIQTDDGILAHMLIVESRNPASDDYDCDEVVTGQTAMKAVVANRLANDPRQFGAPGAKTYTEIIMAPRQWPEFSRDAEGKVVLAAKYQAIVDRVMRTANTGAPGPYHKFVEAVLEVVRKPVSDVFANLTQVGEVSVTGGAFAWVTEGSADPSGRFVAIKGSTVPPLNTDGCVAGNQFYTLSADD